MSDKEAILAKHISGCSCGDIYKSRDMPDPECFWCSYSGGAMEAMEEYAASIQSELDAERETVLSLKNAIKTGSELYAHLKFDDAEFTPYQLALQEAERLKELVTEAWLTSRSEGQVGAASNLESFKLRNNL